MFKDNNVEEGYPRPVSDFGLPSGGVDAAFSWAHNDKTYFFKDQLYWRYDEHTRRMDPGHPAQSPPWRGVPSTLDDAMHWSDGEPGKGESLSPIRKVTRKDLSHGYYKADLSTVAVIIGIEPFSCHFLGKSDHATLPFKTLHFPQHLKENPNSLTHGLQGTEGSSLSFLSTLPHVRFPLH